MLPLLVVIIEEYRVLRNQTMLIVFRWQSIRADSFVDVSLFFVNATNSLRSRGQNPGKIQSCARNRARMIILTRLLEFQFVLVHT